MNKPNIHHPLSVRDGQLYIEDCSTVELAEQFGTPLFVVSEQLLRENAREYRDAFARHWPEGRARIMAAIKANPITAVRRLLTSEGIGCDTFGPGELELALRGGVPTEDIAVNGSIKGPEIIRKAIDNDIHIILDSPAEIDYCIKQAREAGKVAQVLLRVKPHLTDIADMPSDFFPNRTITDMTQTVKYGIPNSELLPMVPRIRDSEHLALVGVHTHSGRHSKTAAFWQSLVRNTVGVIKQIADTHGGDWSPHIVSIGGGFAAEYDIESRVAVTDYETPTIDEFAELVCTTFRAAMAEAGLKTEGLILEAEPGRGLHNETGIHLTKVHVTKYEDATIDRKWLETDTSECFLSVGSLNLTSPFEYVFANKADAPLDGVADIAGVTCNYECLAEQTGVPADAAPGDIIAFLNTGSYIEVYTCNFNALPRPATVLVNGDQAHVIKRRETLEEVFGRDEVPAHLA